MKRAPGWGPAHQDARRFKMTGRRWLVVALIAFLSTPVGEHTPIGLLVVVAAIWFWRRPLRRVISVTGDRSLSAGEAWAVVRGQGRAHQGGVYLGVDRGRWEYSRPESAVLVIGPPRSGKTSGVIIPAVLAHDGPVVSTSTKPDVLRAVQAARSRVGRVWEFDPTGAGVCGQAEVLRWSPVPAARSWDGALLMARAMTAGGVGVGTTEATHWIKRAQALLAPLLHAAAISEQGIEQVLDWVARHECDAPGSVLESAGKESRLAVLSLLTVASAEQRERASIFSATADALDAYTSDGALASASDPNFDARAFVRSQDALFIHAPADHQALAAPLVCGLLSEIRRATYSAHTAGDRQRAVLFALDEVANIAPLPELPAIASEGGGQGLVLLAALQDLSQARARWGAAADGFLTLFGSKLVLRGVADQRTLEGISLTLGEYDRRVVSRSKPGWGFAASTLDSRSGSRGTVTTATQRTRVLSAGEIANLPAGHGLRLDGVEWELLTLTPAHVSEPWKALIGEGSR